MTTADTTYLIRPLDSLRLEHQTSDEQIFQLPDSSFLRGEGYKNIRQVKRADRKAKRKQAIKARRKNR